MSPLPLLASRLSGSLTLLFSLLLLGVVVRGADNVDVAALQKARNEFLANSYSKARFYDEKLFNLDDIPRYKPEQQVTGVIHVKGSDMFGGADLKTQLAEQFRKVQPGVSVEYDMKTNMLAVGGLLDGSADIGITHLLTWETLLAFQRINNCDPLVITAATGWSYEPPFAVYVNADNPITGISMKQLDGMYGAKRSGGWIGTAWHPEFARGSEGNIRNWGRVGLDGSWREEIIHPYSYAVRCMFGYRFSEAAIQGSDKWNENLVEVFNAQKPDGSLYTMDQQILDALAKDRAGIAYVSPLRASSPNVKIIGVQAVDGGPFISLTPETVRDHRYPLADWVYLYAIRKPGQPIDPKVREFLRFILSREGQEIIVKDGKMLPGTSDHLAGELKKLD